MNFWHLVRVIKTRGLIIVAFVLVTLLVILIAAPRPKKLFEAEVYMQPTAQVMAGGATTASNGQGGNAGPDRGVVLSNLMVLARSASVMESALDFLSLSEQDQMLKQPGMRSYKQINRIMVEGKPIDYGSWRDVVAVEPVFDLTIGKEGTTTDVIRIKVTHENADIVPYLTNAIGYAFAEVYRQKSREDTEKYATFLTQSQADARSKLQAVQAQIASYKAKSKVASVDQETAATIGNLNNLEVERDKAAADARVAEAALNDITQQLAREPLIRRENLPAEMSPKVAALQQELSKAEASLREIALKYKPAHPAYQAAQAQVDFIKASIKKESAGYSPAFVNEIHQSLVKQKSQALYDLATARARLNSLQASVSQAQGKIGTLAKAEPELAKLIRDFDQLQVQYKMISEKLMQTQIAAKETTTTGSIVPMSWAPSQASQSPATGPTLAQLLIYGLFLSLVLGVALVVWLDSIDNRMRNAADVEKLLGLPVLGLTPKLPTGKGGNLPQLTHMYPLSAMAESYKILRTNILFAMRDNPFKTLMVATGRPGQGATTTVCNLAIALAQIGKRIILIDADMRRPSLHKFFNVPNEAGLSTLLQGTGHVTDAFQTTDVPNLILVPAGPQPYNPSELIGSERMKEVVQKLEEHCDLVMFDTPSTIVFSDGPMLASWIDAVIMIVSANQVPRGTETVTRDLLRRAKANILGVVVNRMSPENVDSCYYYGHYYSDSVPVHTPQLESGSNGNSGKNGDKHEEKSDGQVAGEMKQILASISEQPAESPEDNPFPD